MKSDVLRPSTNEKIKPHNTPKGRPFKNKNTIFQGDLNKGNNNNGIKDKIIKMGKTSESDNEITGINLGLIKYSKTEK